MCWCLVGRLNPGVLVFGGKVKPRCVGVWLEG